MNRPFPHEAAPVALLGPLPSRRVVRKAVILAAGRGRRMGKLTIDRPKAALEVGGHALIDWQIAALRAAGVEQIAIVTGHRAQALASRDATYIHNPNWGGGTQVETLLCARDWIGDEPVIVSYGDILYHPCAPLALLERPGDIVIGYDADHRWLWKQRFGNWLKDSETFVLGPGQVLTEIGGKPTDIEAIDGQFMGLMLLMPGGLAQLSRRYRAAPDGQRRTVDFTKLLSMLLTDGLRIDTAVNVLPWMEIDSSKDLKVAARMTQRNEINDTTPQLVFPTDITNASIAGGGDELDLNTETAGDNAPAPSLLTPANDGSPEALGDAVWGESRLQAYASIRGRRVENVFAIQNWGRSGSTFVQSLFDDHPQVLSTPNFYSRRYYIAWASTIASVPDEEKIDAFLSAFQQWWDTGLVDATAGLHRLGPARSEIAGVRRESLEGYLRAAFAAGRPITRRNLFIYSHLAYALARGQALDAHGLQILFAVHGEPRGAACALLEDFPETRFIHTVREPASNVSSTIRHLCFNNLDIRSDALESALVGLFDHRNRRYGRMNTMFSDRPYLRYLGTQDQARLLKLEDLHRDGAAIIKAACQWLKLDDHEGLVVSTWDGKTWWNRPESSHENRLGGYDLNRNLNARLNLSDQKKIEMLARAVPSIRAAYESAHNATRHNIVSRLFSTLHHWKQEGLTRRTELRSLNTLLALSGVLPRSLAFRLRYSAARERYRARLIEMSSGSISVRRKLHDTQKSDAVRAVLIVSRERSGWKIRALPNNITQPPDQADYLAVTFLDEAIAKRTVRDQAFWLLILTVGWWLTQLGSYARMRILMAKLLIWLPHHSQENLPALERNTGLPTRSLGKGTADITNRESQETLKKLELEGSTINGSAT